MLELIKTANTSKYDFIHLNNIWRLIIKDSMLKEHEKFMKKCNIKCPEFYITNPHAQFIVSKKRITRNTKNFYHDLYNHVMTTPDCETDPAVSCEYIWQYIFGEISMTPNADYFIPSLDKIIYFENCPFPRKIPLMIQVTTEQEFNKYNELGPYFIQYTECNFDTTGKNIFKCNEEDLPKMITYICALNEKFIKELNVRN